MNLFFRQLLLLACLLFLQKSDASHLVGSDFTYTCLGNGQYELTLTLYRDCGGIGIGTAQMVTIEAVSCGGASSTMMLQMDAANSGIEVSQLCPSVQSQCVGGTYPGVEVYVYEGIITLPFECSNWVVSFSQCCRTAAITNLIDPDFQNLYSKIRINNTNGLCNNSPVFTVRPVRYVCAGTPFTFNHGVVEPDGDQLLFSLAQPKTFGGTPIAHTPGLSASQPLHTSPANNFVFNDHNGQMSFTPQSGSSQVFVLAMEVQEVRNGDTISSIIRDIEVIVLSNCSGNTPVTATAPPQVIRGGYYDSRQNAFNTCGGDTLVFSLTVSDINSTGLRVDEVTTNLDEAFGIGGYSMDTTLTIGNPNTLEVVVTIYPHAMASGITPFIVGFTDEACPIPSITTLGFELVVPKITAWAARTVLCGGIADSVQLGSTTAEIYESSYQWTQIGGITAALSNDTIGNPVLYVPANAIGGDSILYQVYFVTTIDTFTTVQCITADTVVVHIVDIPLSVSVSVSDTSLCPNNQAQTVTLNTSVSGGNVDISGGNYHWHTTPNHYLLQLSDTTIANPLATPAGVAGGEVLYVVGYEYGVCYGADSIIVRFDQALLTVSQDTSICAGDTIQLSAQFVTNATAATGSCGASAANCGAPSQQTTIGTIGTTTGVFPYRGFWEDGRVQMLYRVNELTGLGLTAGKINELAFYVLIKNSTQPFNSFTIKMGCTGANELSTMQGYLSGLTTVYAVPAQTTVSGWNNYSLQTPYEWDGSSNLVIEVCFDNSSWSDDDEVAAENTFYNSMLQFDADGAVGCLAVADYTGYTRPIIRFGSCPLSTQPDYNWTTSSGIFTNNTINVAPWQTSSYIIEANDVYCAISDTITLTVNSNLAIPNVSCGIANDPTTELQFGWSPITGATGWEYSINGGLAWDTIPLGNTQITLLGIPANICLPFYLRPVGGSGVCPDNAPALAECCTDACSGTPIINFLQITSAPCAVVPEGAVSLSAIGGVVGAPYYFFLLDSLGNFVDSTHQTQIGDTISFSNLYSGWYWIAVSDSLGCLDTTAILVDINMPSVTLQLTQDTVCHNGNYLVLSGGNPAGGSFSGAGVSSGQFNPWSTGAGTFPVVYTYTATNGCSNSATDSVYVLVCGNVNTPIGAHSNLYPNPAKSLINIELSPFSQGNTWVEIVDVMGKSVLTPTLLQTSPQTILLPPSLPNGVYICRLRSNEITIVHRFVVAQP